MKEMKKVLATLMVAVMMVTFVGTAMASESISTETVKEVQQALNDAGFNCGTPDGVAGNNTKSAISEYQKEKGLTVTGEIDADLLASLFPAEEPEETEVASEEVVEETPETKVATEETEEATDETEEAKSTTETATTSEAGEAMYTMTPEDAMFFTFDDGLVYRLRTYYDEDFEMDIVVYEQMKGEEVEKELIGSYYIDMVNYFVEKYFYAAKAEEEGLETRDIPKQNLEDYLDKDFGETNPKFFKWEDYSDCNLTYTFSSDNSTYKMYYEDDTVKVGKITDEKVEEILTFEDAKVETEDFININFIRARASDDDEYMMKIYLW